MHVSERLIIYTYLLKTWQHWVNWWKSLMRNQPMPHCVSTHYMNLYFKILQKHISNTAVYLTKKKSKQKKITSIETSRVKTNVSIGPAEEFYLKNNYINLSDWLKEIDIIYRLQILRIKINWCLTFTKKDTMFWGNNFSRILMIDPELEFELHFFSQASHLTLQTMLCNTYLDAIDVHYFHHYFLDME